MKIVRYWTICRITMIDDFSPKERRILYITDQFAPDKNMIIDRFKKNIHQLGNNSIQISDGNLEIVKTKISGNIW